MTHTQEMSNEPDPYTWEYYPKKFQVQIGQHKHNARHLSKAAHLQGVWQNMYRQPLTKEQVDTVLNRVGYKKVDGKWYKRRDARKILAQKKRARREALALSRPPVRNLSSPRRLQF